MKPVEARLHAENRAIYLPAISATYAKAVHRDDMIGSTGMTMKALDFLDPANDFHYPYALYSAGQAAPPAGKAPPADMVTARDREHTIVLGDSGGYQIQTGAIKFGDLTTSRMMTWMESVSDWSMVLDFPTGGIGSGNLRPHVKRLRDDGHDLDALNAVNRLGIDYNACLLQTKLNNDKFLAERTPGATNFLNVLQGRNEAESSHWYEQVKHYPFEGWAFAGAHQNSFSLIVARLLDMKRDGLLERCGWLHILGISQMAIGPLLTAVQRAVRRNGTPNFQISFDTSSPFLMAAKQQVVSGFTLDRSKWSIGNIALSSIDPSENGRLLDKVLWDHHETRKSNLTHKASETVISKLFQIGELRKQCGQLISADGYNLLMSHNVEAYVESHQAAHQAMWGLRIVEEGLEVPVSYKTIASMVGMLIDGKDSQGNPLDDPYRYVKEWSPWLDSLRD